MGYIPLALLSLLLWGFHDFSVKLFSKHMPAELIAGIAAIVGGIFILGFVSFKKISFAADKFTLLSCLIGLLMGLAYVTYLLAIARGPLSIVTPMVALWFIVPSILGVIVLGEGITLTKVTGVAFACLAILLLTR